MVEIRKPEPRGDIVAYYEQLLERRIRRRELFALGIKGAAAVAGTTALASFLQACSGAATQAPTSAPAAGASAGAYSRNFKGITLNVAVGSFMSTGVTLFTDQWQSETGGSVNVIQVPFGDLYQKLYSAFTSHVNAYDVIVYATNWITEFAGAGYIIDLEPYYKYKDNWSSVLPIVGKLDYVNGHRYGIPFDGDVMAAYYRKDAIENPQYVAKFKSQFGYDLQPPATWKQYVDVAKFFTGWDWAKNGKPCYGVLEAFAPKDVGPYIYMTRAATYSVYPGQNGTMFFDPDTMKPQIANPGWVRALEEWKSLLPYGPSQMVTYGGGDQRGNFVAGNYALCVDWCGDIFSLAQDTTKSIVRELLGVMPAPGSTEVYDYKKGAWSTFSTPQYVPYHGWGGWQASITATSKNQLAAWDFANFLDSTANAMTAVSTPGTAREPYRTDEFDPAKFSKYYQPKQYLDVLYSQLTAATGQLDLRIPGAGRYVDTLDKWVQLCIGGQMSAQAALEGAAKEWDQITDQLGRAQQKAFYAQLT